MYTPRVVQIGYEWPRDVDTHQPNGRFPAQPDARAHVGVELRFECVAGIDEDRVAPLFQKDVLVLAAADHQILAADDAALRVGLTDLLIVEPTNGTIAADEEPQLRR